ncbi:hypothetical protein [Neptunicella sp.]|uniref:hypothetical protein n=1 Tax=Neptunicella sp. TaxID=2125986 RepID=UPI003F68FB81
MKLRRPFVIKEDRTNRLQVLSNGGGTQSCCIVVLIAMGCLPKPDIVVMADTEREAAGVFEYQRKYIVPLLESMGIEYAFVKKSDWTDADIEYTNEDGDVSTLPPFYTEINGRDKNNECQKQPGYCSSIWKTKVIKQFLNNKYGTLELTRRGVDFWVGMSLEEKRRIKYPSGKWQKRYPLFESLIVRKQAIQIVQDFGLPEPPRSACWMCPNRHDDEWQWMKENIPSDFEKACTFDVELRQHYDYLYLHRYGKPLSQIDFKKASRSTPQTDIFDQFCDTGMCFV